MTQTNLVAREARRRTLEQLTEDENKRKKRFKEAGPNQRRESESENPSRLSRYLSRCESRIEKAVREGKYKVWIEGIDRTDDHVEIDTTDREEGIIVRMTQREMINLKKRTAETYFIMDQLDELISLLKKKGYGVYASGEDKAKLIGMHVASYVFYRNENGEREILKKDLEDFHVVEGRGSDPTFDISIDWGEE